MSSPLDKAEVIIYQADNETATIEVRVEDETVWLTQAQMAELFQTTMSSSPSVIAFRVCNKSTS